MAPEVSSTDHQQHSLSAAEYKKLRHAFQTYDKDNDGKISASEMMTVLHSFGSASSDEPIRALFHEMDTNDDGFVDFEEFVNISRVALDCSKPSEDIQDAFRVFDLNGDGKISPKELRRVMANLGNTGASIKDCERMIAKWDVNGDGSLDQKEFEKMMAAGFV